MNPIPPPATKTASDVLVKREPRRRALGEGATIVDGALCFLITLADMDRISPKGAGAPIDLRRLLDLAAGGRHSAAHADAMPRLARSSAAFEVTRAGGAGLPAGAARTAGCDRGTDPRNQPEKRCRSSPTRRMTVPTPPTPSTTFSRRCERKRRGPCRRWSVSSFPDLRNTGITNLARRLHHPAIRLDLGPLRGVGAADPQALSSADG